jgi:hypothetical protein
MRKLYHAGIVGGNGILSMNGIRILYPVLNGKETTLESLMKIREYVKVAFGYIKLPRRCSCSRFSIGLIYALYAVGDQMPP